LSYSHIDLPYESSCLKSVNVDINNIKMEGIYDIIKDLNINICVNRLEKYR